jgi:hypothetical protein
VNFCRSIVVSPYAKAVITPPFAQAIAPPVAAPRTPSSIPIHGHHLPPFPSRTTAAAPSSSLLVVGAVVLADTHESAASGLVGLVHLAAMELASGLASAHKGCRRRCYFESMAEVGNPSSLGAPSSPGLCHGCCDHRWRLLRGKIKSVATRDWVCFKPTSTCCPLATAVLPMGRAANGHRRCCKPSPVAL